MKENKRGGKRSGAGRKPSGIEKKTISIYVEKGKIYKFGNEDKMREKLYEFIKEYGEVKVQDLTQTAQIKLITQSPPTTNYSINLQPKPSKSFEQYRQEKREIELPEQWEKLEAEINADMWLTHKQKQILKTIV